MTNEETTAVGEAAEEMRAKAAAGHRGRKHSAERVARRVAPVPRNQGLQEALLLARSKFKAARSHLSLPARRRFTSPPSRLMRATRAVSS